MAALQTAVNAAPPGREILIAPGTYSGGTLTFNRDGTEANPIVIRPQSGFGTVTINNAAWTIADTASRLVFEKLFFEAGRVTLRADHNRISRCRFRNSGAEMVGMETGRDCRI
jgi:Chondroitinase B